MTRMLAAPVLLSAGLALAGCFLPHAPPADISGDWVFSERMGTRESGFSCDSRGTMRFAQQGSAVAMSYRQTGECFIDGAEVRGESDGSGAGTLRGRDLFLEVGECVYQGVLAGAARMEGTMECTVELPGGERVVSGRWEARAGVDR